MLDVENGTGLKPHFQKNSGLYKCAYAAYLRAKLASESIGSYSVMSYMSYID